MTGNHNGTYISREESFMYDREPKFPMHPTMNAGRIEFTEKGVMHMASRRADIVAISRSQAVLALMTSYALPSEFYLEVVSARIPKIGCRLMKVNPNNTIEIRFLRVLEEADLKRIFVYSSHPSHRNMTLDLRG